MSAYTNWYHLDKYEGQDKPNLLDQYNSAMDKVDSALHQIAESGGSIPEDLEQRLGNIESDVDNIESDVDSLKNGLITTNKNLATLDTFVKFDNSIVEIFHDNTTTPSGYSTWEYLAKTVFKNWSYNEHNGQNMGWSRPNDNGVAALQYIRNVAETQDLEYRTSVTLVIASFGYWDIYGNNEFTTTDFETLGRTFVNTAKLLYPNADIFIYPLTTNCFGINRSRMLNFYALIYGATRSQVPIYYTSPEDAFILNICQPIHYEDDQTTYNGGGTNSIGAQIKCSLYGNSFRRGTRLNLPGEGYVRSFYMEMWISGYYVYTTSGSMNVLQELTPETVIGHVPAILTPSVKTPVWTVIDVTTKTTKGFIYIATNGDITIEGENNIPTGTYRCIGCNYESAFSQTA